jgi:hypothetical protein
MANTLNNFVIDGTLYKKDVRKIPNKKEPDKPDWEFRSIILEITTHSGSKTFTDLPEFQLGNGVGYDEFEIGDFISVRFSLGGKKISDTWHKTELRCSFIKHADIQANEGIPAGRKEFKPIKIDADIAPPVPEDIVDEDYSDGLPF